MRITATWPDGDVLAWQDGALEPDPSVKGELLKWHGRRGDRVLASPEGPEVAVADWPTDPYAFLGGCADLLAGVTPKLESDTTLPELGPSDLDGEFALTIT